MRWLLLSPLFACSEPLPMVEVDAALARTLQDTLDDGRRALGFAGVTLAVQVPGQPTWAGSSGLANVDSAVTVDVTDRFRIGSITKTFVTATAVRLASQGVVRLDEPVSTWLDWLERGDRITLRLLLSHRTGIVDYTDTGAFIGALDDPWTPREIIDLCLESAPLFEVDADHRYSNTNFYVAALVLEEATGRSIHDLVREHTLTPLALDQTYLEGPESLPGGIVSGYLNGAPMAQLDPSWHWAAGGMVSTVGDLMVWGDALLAGDFLTDAERDAMWTRETTAAGALADYGLGLRFETTPCGDVVGHTGSTMGFQSDLFLSDRGILVAVLANDFVYEASDIAYAACEAATDWLDAAEP